jgi:GNAT superfamily N-acetyltransferase
MSAHAPTCRHALAAEPAHPPATVIRPPAPGEEAALAALMRAMEAHYGVSVGDGVAEKAAATLCRGQGPGLCLVAASGEGLLGAVFFAELFPGAGLAPVFYMKDLFVLPAARGQGHGAALVRAVAALARQRGIGRVEWTTGTDNLAARRFYAGLGASQPAKVCLQLDEAGIARLAVGTPVAGTLDPAAETRD